MAFLIPTTTIAGIPRYIPKFNAITESPILKTSDSDSALSINDNVEIIGVIATFTASLKYKDSGHEVFFCRSLSPPPESLSDFD